MEQLLRQIELHESGQSLGDGWEITLIYQGRNRLYRLRHPEDGDYVVKVFGRLSWWRRLYYSYIGKTKARRSYEYAQALAERGIATPTPLGYKEERNKYGLLGRSYYICDYEALHPHIHNETRGLSAPEGFLPALATYIVGLHQLGIVHEDLSPGNLPYRSTPSGYQFYLVDLNRMRLLERPLTPEEAFDNLKRLCSSYSVGLQLAYYYASVAGWDMDRTVRGINACSDKFFSKRNFKLSLRYAKRYGNLSPSLFILQHLCYRLVRRIRRLLPKGTAIGTKLYQWEEQFYTDRLSQEDLRQAILRREGYRSLRPRFLTHTHTQ